MTESVGSAADNLEEADANEVLLDELKRQKKIAKMQLTKLYSRLMKLMSEEDAILLAFETVEEKRLDGIQILEDLIIIYVKRGDKKNVDRSNDVIEKIIEATDKEIAGVKDFLSFLSIKPSSKEFLKAKRGPDQRDWKLEEVEEIIPKKGDEIPAPSPHPSRPFNLSADKKLPTFNGDKTKFDYFSTAFESIVDDSDEPVKYKMVRLKACLQGKAEESISKLGFSEEAYEETKNTLKRRFGGERRQLQNYLEELKKIRSIQEGNVQELEKFADTLVSTVVTLREHKRLSEL